MDDLYSHLNPRVAEKIALSDEERILWLQKDRWIKYDQADDILDEMRRVITSPKKLRMPNMLLVGDANAGKSSIAERILKEFPRATPQDSDYVHVPVLSIECPPSADENSLYSIILDDLFAIYRSSAKLPAKRSQVAGLFQRIGLQTLIIDEIHNILPSRFEKQRNFLNELKFMSNTLKISLIAIGTTDALKAMQLDPQIASRFPPMFLEKWKYDKRFLKLLNSFEASLPLKQASNLSQPALAKKIHRLTEGLLGEVADFLNRLAIKAITSHAEKISLELIANFDWVEPKQRRTIRAKAKEDRK